ncbi:MAG: DUF2191 domain-containing protein [Deltaproteobacteria bacterium]|nr:DUF2191 domain-containing protein [Deltaproteobacteria bacterium]MBW1816629.1 DUF2191 domain-containing protein [Deltaproteobacteria bacterium]MBW2284911.1 DUF2191 domain-containing protein [Deltaproteobacteria bacterium]
MRTTVRINENLLLRAKKRAAEENRTLTSLIEDGLALILSEATGGRRKKVKLPVSKATGGVRSGVDLNRASDLEEVMNTP